MSVAAAIRLTSPDEDRVIANASSFARKHDAPLFVVSVVSQLPYGDVTGEQDAAVSHNIAAIAAANASPIIQEGDDIPRALLSVGISFGISTMFLQRGTSSGLHRSIAERLLCLDPPFDVVVLPDE